MSIFSRLFPRQLPNFWAMGQDCVLCGVRSDAALVCADCAASLPRVDRVAAVPRTLDAAVAVFEYRFPVDRLVQRFKYSADFAVGRWLAQRLAERVADEPRPDLLVAPPLTSARLRRR